MSTAEKSDYVQGRGGLWVPILPARASGNQGEDLARFMGSLWDSNLKLLEKASVPLISVLDCDESGRPPLLIDKRSDFLKSGHVTDPDYPESAPLGTTGYTILLMKASKAAAVSIYLSVDFAHLKGAPDPVLTKLMRQDDTESRRPPYDPAELTEILHETHALLIGDSV